MGLAVLNAQKTASTVTLTQGLRRRIIETFDEGAALLAGRGMSRLHLDISSSVRFGGPALCESLYVIIQCTGIAVFSRSGESDPAILRLSL